jgi:hypothetical protein
MELYRASAIFLRILVEKIFLISLTENSSENPFFFPTIKFENSLMLNSICKYKTVLINQKMILVKELSTERKKTK